MDVAAVSIEDAYNVVDKRLLRVRRLFGSERIPGPQQNYAFGLPYCEKIVFVGRSWFNGHWVAFCSLAPLAKTLQLMRRSTRSAPQFLTTTPPHPRLLFKSYLHYLEGNFKNNLELLQHQTNVHRISLQRGFIDSERNLSAWAHFEAETGSGDPRGPRS